MSSFSWIAFSDDERERALDIISQFHERETRDELGVSRIRDAFAGLLFPGTSTIQTRARYFLFVPWLYRTLERRRVPSEELGAKLKQAEDRLRDALLENDDTDGVVGKFAGKDLQRYPSDIYWNGLETWGIRRFSGSQSRYVSSLDDYYTLLDDLQRTDTDDPVEGPQANWDPSLPSPPDGFPGEASLQLTRDEARYLKQRIHEAVPDSMISSVLEIGELGPRTDFPWEYAHLGELPANVREVLRHARNFSEVIHGAPLLYNRLLAEERGDDDLIASYADRLERWAALIDSRLDELRAWNRERFWAIVDEHSATKPVRMVYFVDDWIDLALESPSTVIADEDARTLVREREVQLKRGHSRFTNQRALEQWGGEAGIGRLAYRWGITQTHLEDLFAGLEGP